jgi:hypothetical protein
MWKPACVLGALVVVALGCGGKTDPSCSPAPEIASSSVAKNGDTWQATITSNIEAPIDKVLEAASHPERGHDLVPENIMKSEIVGEAGNQKTLDIVARLDILPPGFKVQNIKTEYTYYPQEKRFTTKSIDFKLADITSEYKFAPSDDGKGTLLTFTQQSKDKAPMIVESLQKGALCETFSIQVKVMRRALGLEKAEQPAG